MGKNSPENFADSKRAIVVAPAGCGKTELIARAIVSRAGGRDLLLTHTHAGVRALRDRLKRDRVSSTRAVVDTIASWCLRIAASYPHMSGLKTTTPTADGWADVYESAVRLLDEPVIRFVIKNSYTGVYVDEYQDCTQRQHAVIKKLAALLPCRAVGDPLQGIFGFKEPVVEWDAEVFALFDRLPDLAIPWRWKNRHEALGQWLLDLRQQLVGGETIDLSKAPLRWRVNSPENQLAVCYAGANGDRSQSVVAIDKWPKACHEIASKLNGAFASMEPTDCPDLLTWALDIERTSGADRALCVIEGAARCRTALNQILKRERESFAAGSPPPVPRRIDRKPVRDGLINVARSETFGPVLETLQAIEQLAGTKLYRRELWSEMKRTIRAFEEGGHASLWEAAWVSRQRSRSVGRRVDQRSISRTLLVKGLEFDHAIVLNADALDARNLYVALTRGSRSLTVLSAKSSIRKENLSGIAVPVAST